MSILTNYKSLFYYLFVLLFMALTFWVYLKFEKALRQFESDADLHDHNLVSENGDPSQLVFPQKKLTENGEEEEQRRDTDIEAYATDNPQAAAGDMTNERPLRILIDTLNEMKTDKLEKISSRSQNLRFLVKVPMVMLILLAAVTSGTSVLLLKISDTIVQKG